MPRTTIFEKGAGEQLAPGVWLDRLQPGGRAGPNREALAEVPGGQVWNDFFLFGGKDDAFQMCVPDIRMPPNQYWPLHWHDCWIAVVVIEGTCLIGDWWMQPGDVLVSAAGLEYGPLVPGPSGVQLFEIFARLHLQAGGYSPEYRDHPTLAGTGMSFLGRSDVNRRNEGRSSLPCDGVEGLSKGHLVPGWEADLGEPGDPERGALRCTGLGAGETIAPHRFADWHGFFVLDGSIIHDGREMPKGSVLIVEPDSAVGSIKGGRAGAMMLEVARTARGMDRQFAS